MRKKKETPENTIAVQDYLFTDGKLSDEATVVTSALTKTKGFIMVVENIPVSTFRGGNYYKEIVDITPDEELAIKKHEDRVKQALKIVKGEK